MALILGADPGFSGAIALLDSATRELKIFDMPTIPTAKGRAEIDLYTLGKITDPDEIGQRKLAVLEKVSAMPNQGVTGVFRFGEGYGALRMAIVGHGWEDRYVPPATWKKHFGISKVKSSSRQLAMQRFPDNRDQFTRVKDDGRAEAALIALYGLEKLL